MDRPCLLVLVTDQQRYRAHWPKDVSLPGLERLEREGRSFTRAYTPSALCTPARAALFTGRHASATKMDDNVNFFWQSSLPPATPTLGTLLSALRYTTSYIGKWHLTKDNELNRHGLTPYGFSDWVGPDRHGKPNEGLSVDPIFACDAVSWLSRHKGDQKPWCLVVSLVNPHDIMFSPRVKRPTDRRYHAPYPAHFGDSLESKPSIQQRFRHLTQLVAGYLPRHSSREWEEFFDAYVDYHLAVDRCIEQILNFLDDSKLSDRTLVMYTSDHGELGGAHGLRGKGPCIYEENSRVPLVVRWPNVIAAESVTEALYSSVDTVATLVSIAGGKPPAGLSGRDQSAVIFGREHTVRDELLFQYRARCTLGMPWSKARGFLIGRFDGRYKYARYHAQNDAPFASGTFAEEELYDLENDPLELQNLAHSVNLIDSQRRATEALALRECAMVK